MGKDLQQLSRAQLLQLLEQLMERVALLEQRHAALEAKVARLRRNSSTSSKPPSSDLVKPPPATPARRGGKRRVGGQPGHERHTRTPFSPEQLDAAWEYTLSACPDCGGALRVTAESPRVMQQIELVARPVRLEEHRAVAQWCPACQQVHWSPLPAEVVHGGLVGPRLTAPTWRISRASAMPRIGPSSSMPPRCWGYRFAAASWPR